jgi:hypothetical protein
MASLTYQRLIKGLNSLAEKAMTDLPGPTFSHHRDEISRLIKDGLAAAQAGLAQLPGSESPGQIKHWVGEKVDEILKTPARNKRITRSTTRSTTATAAGFKKRYNSRAKSSAAAHSTLPATSSTRADIECANTLLSAGIARRSSRRSARVPTFTREDIECASILLELAFKPIVFDRLARISTAPVAKDFWSVIA